MSSVMDLIKEKRIVPVVKIDRVEDALPLAKALIDGGLPVAEITFRTDAAEESIRVIRENYPQMYAEQEPLSILTRQSGL